MWLFLAGCLSACALGGESVPAGQEAPQSTEPALEAQPLPGTYTPAASASQPPASATAGPTSTPVGEAGNPVLNIPLAGPVADRRAELSGLAWYGDYLIILPQFPDFDDEGSEGFLYALSKAEILAFLDGQDEQPLEPRPVPFVAPGLEDRIAGFEGYEGIAFSDDQAYMLVEASNDGAMLGYLVKGTMDPELAGLTLDSAALAVIAPQTNFFNIAEESLFVVDGLVGVIHELNGAKINPAPIVHLFSPDLTLVGVVAFPNVPFRITDASALDAGGRFWAINYFYPGSDEVLDVFGTPEGQATGNGLWPAWEGLGRLIEFQFSPSGIMPAGTAPIQLESNLSDIHNWEGLARLDDRGFLLVSDEIPDTALGFVPFPNSDE